MTELLIPTVEALKSMGGDASSSQLLAAVIERVKVPRDVAAIKDPKHGGTKLGYHLAWAKTCLKMGGVIQNSAPGVWSITDVGNQMSSDEITKVPNKIRKRGTEGNPKPA